MWLLLVYLVFYGIPSAGGFAYDAQTSFVATLELARTGKAQLAQEETFGPLRVRAVKA